MAPVIHSRVLLENPETGITTIHHYDDTTDEITYEDRFDVEDLFNQNHDEQMLGEVGRANPMRKVASIPLPIYYELKRRGIIDEINDPKGIKLFRWLEDRDHLKFRVWDGRLV